MKPYLEKPFTKIGLVEWLKVKALNSSPSTEKKKRAGEEVECLHMFLGVLEREKGII
jgi:hypothetical protein